MPRRQPPGSRALGPSRSEEALADNRSSLVIVGKPRVPAPRPFPKTLVHLHESLDALPALCRQIMTLQKIDGLSADEIAARLGLSLATVESWLAVGLVHCRRFLVARGAVRDCEAPDHDKSR